MKTHDFFRAIRDHSKTKGIAQHILFILASRADDDGHCFPSYRDLARITGYSLKTIARAIKEIQVDELQIVSQGGSTKGDNRQSTRYRILIGNRSHSDHGQSGNHSQPDHGQSTDRSHRVHPTVVTESTDRSHRVHLSNHEETNEETKARKRAVGVGSFSAVSSKSEDPPIPLMLQTPAFRKAWADFDQHRRNGRAKKDWTYRAKELALETCLDLGPDKAIATIKRAIISGWTGIFERNDSFNHKPKSGPSLDEFGLPKL